MSERAIQLKEKFELAKKEKETAVLEAAKKAKELINSEPKIKTEKIKNVEESRKKIIKETKEIPNIIEVEKFLSKKTDKDEHDTKLLARLAKDGKNFDRLISVIKEMIK